MDDTNKIITEAARTTPPGITESWDHLAGRIRQKVDANTMELMKLSFYYGASSALGVIATGYQERHP